MSNDQLWSHDSRNDSVNADKANPFTLSNRRRAALKEIDDAPFSWFHARVCLVAGAGFFTDAYDIFAISIASVMLGYVYGTGSPRKLNANQDLGIKVATPVGNLVGQLFFGWLADILGRKRMYGIELIIIIIATFAQALAGDGPAVSIIGVLIVWRFLMGIGVGGDYPLSAVIASEFAAMRIRGRMMTAVFSMQGWGYLTATLVALITVAAYKDSILGDPNPNKLDEIWRILIGFGCVPGCIALYFRLTIPETPRFTMDIERNIQQASRDLNNVIPTSTFTLDRDAPPIHRVNAPKASWSDFLAYFGQWKNGKVLLGTSWSWFVLDIAFYGLTLNSPIMLQTISFVRPPASTMGTQLIYDTLMINCIGNLIFCVGGLLPGYYFTFLFIDSRGRKPIQFMGFSLLTILFLVLGFAFDELESTSSAKKGFVVLYCFTNFFQNFGPNTTTFIIPGEVFPTRYRSTAHGISAASGRLGAIIAQIIFAKFKGSGGNSDSDSFVKHILQIFAFFMLTGIVSTLLLPETKGLSLEELSNEKQEDATRTTQARDSTRFRASNSINLAS